MFTILIIFIFGLIIGSFLNCLIWRLHKKEGIMDRSYCPNCRHQIFWYDNIPLLSFLILGGKCRHCREKISWQYPLVELITAAFFVLAWQRTNSEFITHDLLFIIHLLRDWFIIAVMIIIFIYDFRWYLILDIITLPAAIVILILNLILGFSWSALLISAAVGASFFLVQFLVSRGRWIGGGDVRLGLLMGLVFGRLDFLILAIMSAYFMGSLVGVSLILLKKKKWSSQMPLGVFLSLASILVLFWGQEILNWYFNFF